jgi:sulfite exporter TauE/SafE
MGVKTLEKMEKKIFQVKQRIYDSLKRLAAAGSWCFLPCGTIYSGIDTVKKYRKQSCEEDLGNE